MKSVLAFACLAISLASTVGAQTPGGAAPPGKIEIQWEVLNRMRLLSPVGNARLEKAWSDIQTQSAPRPASVQSLLLSLQSRRAQGKAMIDLDEVQGFDRSTGRYAPWYVNPKGQMVQVHLTADVVGRSCEWKVDRPAFILASQGRCSALALVPHGVATEVILADGQQVVAKNEITVEDRLIVAYGDSYSSGEGNPDIPAQYGSATPASNDWIFRKEDYVLSAAEWWDRECHRSLLSWPVFSAIKMALTDKRRTVTLLDYACSGAEVIDGIFLAQLKPFEASRNKEGPRDGEIVPSDLADKRTVVRSQINALSADLCADRPTHKVIKRIPGANGLPFVMETCRKPIREPDFLVLTIGGNDIKFGPTVQGIMMPNRGLDPLRTVFMGWARSFAGVESPKGLGQRAERATEHYAQQLNLIATSSFVTPDKMVLVRYPNPVATNLDLTGGCDDRWSQHHFNNYMAFGVVVPKLIPAASKGWLVRFTDEEIKDFMHAFPKIQAMQAAPSCSGVRVIDALLPEAVPTFSGRLLCSPIDEGTREAFESRYFCEDKECSADRKTVVPAKSLGSWAPYAAGGRMAYSLNEALLTQRSWAIDGKKNNWSSERVKETLGGTMHLTAEMHAAAGDAAHSAMTSTEHLMKCPKP